MRTVPITARITMPPSARRGDVVPVRVLVRHGMERATNAAGVAPTPRKILHSFRVTYGDEEVFRMNLSTGITANPYVEFTTVATESGTLVFEWQEDGGAVYRREAQLDVT
ncbi:thiosulfate oxidation carrier complex protein SoxZ [Roseomonas sp. CCTCC AB2023176]|uniref:thiosulfate oxidation carrier complex protein SoxZ n=1 Tax=Roseomonas sp. CCTCC AB2023176 TaxID=3342640 RepID=UPI0035DC88EB